MREREREKTYETMKTKAKKTFNDHFVEVMSYL